MVANLKVFFPYDWFDSPEKLDETKLPEYKHWNSKLRNGYLLTKERFQECNKIWMDYKMKTFEDWVKYYHDLDVQPFIESKIDKNERIL